MKFFKLTKLSALKIYVLAIRHSVTRMFFKIFHVLLISLSKAISLKEWLSSKVDLFKYFHKTIKLKYRFLIKTKMKQLITIYWFYAREQTIVHLGDRQSQILKANKIESKKLEKSIQKSKMLNQFCVLVPALLELKWLGIWKILFQKRKLEFVREEINCCRS